MINTSGLRNSRKVSAEKFVDWVSLAFHMLNVGVVDNHNTKNAKPKSGHILVGQPVVFIPPDCFAAGELVALACININEFPHNSEQLSSRLAIFSMTIRNAFQPLEAHNIDFFVIVVSRPGYDFFYVVQVHLFILSVR